MATEWYNQWNLPWIDGAPYPYDYGFSLGDPNTAYAYDVELAQPPPRALPATTVDRTRTTMSAPIGQRAPLPLTWAGIVSDEAPQAGILPPVALRPWVAPPWSVMGS